MNEEKYGGCEGPDAMYVKLISSDGHEFIVKREHALTSGTIKGKLAQKILTGCLRNSSFPFSYALGSWTICRE